MKVLLLNLLATLFFATSLFAAESVRFSTSTPTMTFTTDQTVTIIVDEPAGDGTAESSPAVAYLPAKTTFGELGNFLLKDNTTLDIPDVDAKSSSEFLNIDLTLTNTEGDGNDRVIQVAVRDGSSGDFLFADTADLDVVSNNSTSTVTKTLTFEELCKEISNCDDFSTDDTSKIIYMYFFPALSTKTFSDGETIDSTNSDSDGGVFVELQVSNDSLDDVSVSITNVKKGDGSLTYTLDASSEPEDFRDVLPISFNTASITTSGQLIAITTFNSGGVTNEVLNNDDFPDDQFEGEFVVDGLANGTAVNMAFALRNKFFWTTPVSALSVETPLDIEELLTKEACYLFTAGFGKEHWLIDHYKKFRDGFLLNRKWGRSLVRYYYKTAPKAAMYIYKRSWLRKLIRGAAYLLYPFTKPLVDQNQNPSKVKQRNAKGGVKN